MMKTHHILPVVGSGSCLFFILASDTATVYAELSLMNQAALGMATWYSVRVIKISSFLLKFGAFFANWDRGLLPRNMNFC